MPNGAIYGGTITSYSVAEQGASSLYFDTHENIKIAFDEAGITIPYPQMDVHIDKPDGNNNEAQV